MGLFDSTIGALTGSTALKAGKTLANSAQQGIDLQNQVYGESKANLQPYLQTGTNAINRLGNLLGLGQGTSDPWTTGDEAGYNKWLTTGNATGGTADNSANRAQYAAGNGINQTYTKGDDFGSLLKQFTGADLVNDPGYQFSLNEGNKAINNKLAGSGGYFSGAAAKALDKYNQDYAGTKFNEGFNRDQTNKNSIYSMLSGTAGSGQNAANTLASLGQGYANATSDLYGTQGSALANGMIGQANQINQTISSLAGGASGGGIGSSYTSGGSPQSYVQGGSTYYDPKTGISWNR